MKRLRRKMAGTLAESSRTNQACEVLMICDSAYTKVCLERLLLHMANLYAYIYICIYIRRIPEADSQIVCDNPVDARHG